MGFVGRNAARLDARVTCVIGALLFFASMYMMSIITIDVGVSDLFWPLILRGVGLGLIFVPLTGATMAELKDSELPQGTGMFNLTRQLGGSLGIAIMATLLTRFMVVEKSLLAEHVVAGDPQVVARLAGMAKGLIARGVDPAQAQRAALAILDRQIGAQASVLAFSKIYLLSGILLVAALPVLLLFHTGKSRAISGSAAH
jgi:DHA2 family multidrug resistance protein